MSSGIQIFNFFVSDHLKNVLIHSKYWKQSASLCVAKLSFHLSKHFCVSKTQQTMLGSLSIVIRIYLTEKFTCLNRTEHCLLPVWKL